MTAVARRPRSLAALILLLLRTRREYVSLSESRAGQALDRYLNQRSLGVLPRNRFCRGVLLVPPDHADYLRGRRRQALRTNLRRAAAAGIRCEVVSDSRGAFDVASCVLGRRGGSLSDTDERARMDELCALFARPEITVTVARDRDGLPMAVAASIIDEMVCLVEMAVAVCHEGRWALHDHLVRTLSARRVRYLLVDGGGPFGALGLPANLRHYQHLLGYELRHVIPVSAHPATFRRHLLAFLVALATAAALIALPAAASTAVGRSLVTAGHTRPGGCGYAAEAHPDSGAQRLTARAAWPTPPGAEPRRG